MSQPSRARHLRHRVYSRLRHGVTNILKAFVDGQGSRLASTATGRTFTANSSTDVLTSSTHGFLTGKGPIEVSNSGGGLPGGLAASTLYWPIKIDADTFKLATTRENAAAGVAIDITSNGTGTQTAKYATSGAAMLERLRQGVDPNQLRGTSDVDNL